MRNKGPLSHIMGTTCNCFRIMVSCVMRHFTLFADTYKRSSTCVIYTGTVCEIIFSNVETVLILPTTGIEN